MKHYNLCATSVDGSKNNAFVGIRICGNVVNFYYPESYAFDPGDYTNREILDLLKTIHIAKTHSSELNEMNNLHENESDTAIGSCIWIIEDYIKNGDYFSREKVYRNNKGQRVDWKKTIQKMPYISEGNVLYSTLVRESYARVDSTIQEIYRYCVWKSLSLVGWVYDLSQSIVEKPQGADKLISYYITVIQTELKHSFDDVKGTRLKHMRNILEGLDVWTEDQEVVYGVDKYDYVFERMVNSIFGNADTSKYSPKFSWNLSYPIEIIDRSATTLKPDTILKDGENLLIIDSKFYRYGAVETDHIKYLPGAESIVKQLVYSMYIEQTEKADIRNVFILPYKSPLDGESIQYAGSVAPNVEFEKLYGRIHVVLVDLKYAVQNWNAIRHDADKRKLVNMVISN